MKTICKNCRYWAPRQLCFNFDKRKGICLHPRPGYINTLKRVYNNDGSLHVRDFNAEGCGPVLGHSLVTKWDYGCVAFISKKASPV